jgi:CPA2 family monovalent cation:H+ antiporter-2
VLLVVALVSVGKGLVFAGLGAAFGYGNVVPLALGLGLFQVGEFSFVLARVGLRGGSIDEDVYAIVLSTAVITMAMTPLAARATGAIYERLRHRRPAQPPITVNLPRAGLSDHAIVAGGGRVGQRIAQVFRDLGIQAVVIELDQRRLEQCRDEGLTVVYGDASYEPVLEAAGLSRARVLVSAIPEPQVNRRMLRLAHHIRPEVEILARATSVDEMRDLRRAGADEVVQPELEASLALLEGALARYDVDGDEIDARLDEIRRREGWGDADAPVDGSPAAAPDPGAPVAPRVEEPVASPGGAE